MKIVAVTPDYLPHSRVGAWMATHQFLAHLSSLGHQVAVISRRHRSHPYAVGGVVVEAGAAGRHSARPAWADVIVSHAGDGGLGFDLAAEHGKPVVRMVHGAGYDRIGNADLAVFNSHSLRDLAGWDGLSIVCHPPVDPSAHRVEQTGDAVTIVNCSQEKGIKTAWRCAEHLPDRRFLGVKGGYGHQVIPRSPNFEVLPTQQDMRAVWSSTRVLLVPSAYETWGMVGVEAMCSGIPVIAHPTPGLQESLGPAGIFVDRDDTDGWVRELRRLDDPTEYATASTAARERVAELIPEMKAGLDRFAAAVEVLCR